ncbi:MAG: 1-(5-phosphoribosyl)-5-amino-4-imidazole-carboxylate carboxylase [Clostridiaceae bacterium BRH_c20a]|nr:MAG: 1-(5-phosphoribosyl)-5-amino-4-imidazole-carboxylate carboxylase [Clostridiaceae bacterium BRH_c20a]
MQEKELRKLLEQLQKGNIDINGAVNELKLLPFKDLGFAKVDFHRELRQGHPEVVFCQGKTPEQVKEIVKVLADRSKNILATRADEAAYEAVLEVLPEAQYFKAARIVKVNEEKVITGKGTILVVSAGTADIPVAEEAVITAEAFGNKVERLYDVGVAGLHRLLTNIDKLNEARVIIVVAGMEGALASVVGGLVNVPVVAVPTSVGYGASFNGLSALLTMLNSCAAGVGVVNIDNGFGAARLASVINSL